MTDRPQACRMSSHKLVHTSFLSDTEGGTTFFPKSDQMSMISAISLQKDIIFVPACTVILQQLQSLPWKDVTWRYAISFPNRPQITYFQKNLFLEWSPPFVGGGMQMRWEDRSEVSDDVKLYCTCTCMFPGSEVCWGQGTKGLTCFFLSFPRVARGWKEEGRKGTFFFWRKKKRSVFDRQNTDPFL